jgi:hypothetical protein
MNPIGQSLEMLEDICVDVTAVVSWYLHKYMEKQVHENGDLF